MQKVDLFAHAQDEDKPVISVNLPKDLPLKVELVDSDKKEVLKELKLRVTNTGVKPIFMFQFILSPTDIVAPNGYLYGFSIAYNGTQLPLLESIAPAGSDSLKPGETVELKVKERAANTFKRGRELNNLSYPQQFKIEFVYLSYGDGTGLLGTGGTKIGTETNISKPIQP